MNTADNKAQTKKRRSGKAITVAAILLGIAVNTLVGFAVLYKAGEFLVEHMFWSDKEEYNDFTPALRRTLKKEYCLDIPDSAELTYGEYRGSWDYSSLEVSFLVRADEFEGMLTDGAWTESEGDRHAIAVYTLSSGRKRSGAKLTVKYYDGYEGLYRCYLKYGAY